MPGENDVCQGNLSTMRHRKKKRSISLKVIFLIYKHGDTGERQWQESSSEDQLDGSMDRGRRHGGATLVHGPVEAHRIAGLLDQVITVRVIKRENLVPPQSLASCLTMWSLSQKLCILCYLGQECDSVVDFCLDLWAFSFLKWRKYQAALAFYLYIFHSMVFWGLRALYPTDRELEKAKTFYTPSRFAVGLWRLWKRGTPFLLCSVNSRPMTRPPKISPQIHPLWVRRINSFRS